MGNLDKCEYININVLKWARETAGYELQEIAKTFKKIADWENGKNFPTYKQLEKLAGKYKRPVAVFFSPTAPTEETIKKSFRAVYLYEKQNTVSPHLRYLLRKAKAAQINLSELNNGVNPADKKIIKEFSFQLNSSLVDTVKEIRNYLGINLNSQLNWHNVDDAFEQWRKTFAENGIFVFKDAFKAEGFSGFCLYDEEFPIIYINNSNSKSRQIFTLFHELAHLLFRINGIDVQEMNYIEYMNKRYKNIETFCNHFASSFLVPDDDFDKRIRGEYITDEMINRFANNLYKVSREVILRKLIDRKLINQKYYNEKIKAWNKKNIKQSKGGGDFFNTQIAYLGKQYLNLVFNEYYKENITTEQLADYLNIKPKNIDKLEDKFLRTMK